MKLNLGDSVATPLAFLFGFLTAVECIARIYLFKCSGIGSVTLERIWKVSPAAYCGGFRLQPVGKSLSYMLLKLLKIEVWGARRDGSAVQVSVPTWQLNQERSQTLPPTSANTSHARGAHTQRQAHFIHLNQIFFLIKICPK